MTSTVTCPSCGAQTSGKFCAECGQPLGSRACAKCGVQLSAKAKFCPECGTTVAGGTPRGAAASAGSPAPAARGGLADKLPWIIAGLALVALVVTIVLVVGRRPGGAADAAATGGMPFDPNRGTTDLTNMTPRDAADRLYDRTARAASAGDSAQVRFFGPMTVQAYQSVVPLDADARLHIGLVHLNLGQADSALMQADSISRATPTHLFASALRAQAATQRGDAAASRRAYAEFLRNYDSEIAKNLGEYEQHTAMLTEIRTAAQAAR